MGVCSAGQYPLTSTLQQRCTSGLVEVEVALTEWPLDGYMAGSW